VYARALRTSIGHPCLVCCLVGHQPDYTRTTQALLGGSRSYPVIAGSTCDEMPALAGNSGSQPAVPVAPVPVCHAGGRGFESRRSRESSCKSAYCVVRPDAKVRPTTQTRVRVGPNRPKTGRKRIGEPRRQAVCGRVEADREGGARLHKIAGGQGSAWRRRRTQQEPSRPPSQRGVTDRRAARSGVPWCPRPRSYPKRAS
jgi:hypothetical protein